MAFIQRAGRKAYNRSVSLRHSLPLLFLVLLLGCSRGAQTPEAVRQGVIEYLSTRSGLDLASMQVEVTSVSFRQDQADATVAFRPKGGGPASGIEMRYTLERQGARWVVKGKGQAPTGEAPHGSAQGPAELPPGHPSLGQAKPSGTAK
jgi:hypothetical protein